MSKILTTYRGILLDVDYDYEPFTEPTRNHPGSYERVDINTVEVCGTDVMELLDPGQMEELSTQILEDLKIKSQEDYFDIRSAA